MEATMAGESLFNDGVGIVLFMALVTAAVGGEPPSAAGIARAFLLEGVGGLALGAGLGWIASRLLSRVDEYPLEIFVTLALACSGYTLATAWHLSGPLTTVAAGLVIGSYGRQVGMSPRTREHLDGFWTVVDEALNAVLFLLVGLAMLLVPDDRQLLLLGALAIPAVLLARWASVAPLVALLGRGAGLGKGATGVLTWGGLRGGISIALALSIPAGALRDTLVTATYVVVVFSVLVQGLTLGRVVRRN
jgi:CPA1 family monovalent cation:H+ antiporter